MIFGTPNNNVASVSEEGGLSGETTYAGSCHHPGGNKVDDPGAGRFAAVD